VIEFRRNSKRGRKRIVLQNEKNGNNMWLSLEVQAGALGQHLTYSQVQQIVFVAMLFLGTFITWVLFFRVPKQKRETLQLRNGMNVYSFQKGETEFLYEEIWESDTYVNYGLKLEKGDVVFDVGANIGMFSMYCASKVDGDITLFSFEPMPKIHDLCNENLKRFVASKGGRVTCLQKGVSSEPGDAVFDFHKNFSLWSTARPEFNDRRNDRLVRDLPAMTRGFKESGRMSWFFNTIPHCVVACLARLFLLVLSSTEKVQCKLTTLSAVIEEHNVEKINLLKVDVEGCEELVLDGIEEKDWGKIKQITLEVEDFAAVKRVTKRLQAKGFQVKSAETERLANPDVTSEVSHLWAWREA
jgi:FkbM family methyltransferase